MKYKIINIKAVTIDRDLEFSTVDCKSVNCTECCEKLSPYLTEEELNSGNYVYTLINVHTDTPAIAIPRIKSGCVYLDHNKQCTIYDIRPKACRQFDCRLNHHEKITNKFESDTL